MYNRAIPVFCLLLLFDRKERRSQAAPVWIWVNWAIFSACIETAQSGSDSHSPRDAAVNF